LSKGKWYYYENSSRSNRIFTEDKRFFNTNLGSLIKDINGYYSHLEIAISFTSNDMYEIKLYDHDEISYTTRMVRLSSLIDSLNTLIAYW